MRNWRRHVWLGLVLCVLSAARGEDTTPALSALERLPVKEVTVFKDGHAFMLHQGSMPTDARGNVRMDYLPQPVLGTFWPFAAQGSPKLVSTTAGTHRVKVARSPLTIRELIEANPGAEVMITESPAGETLEPSRYAATILRITERSARELEAVAPPNSGEFLPQKGTVVLLRTIDGVKAVELSRIRDVTFKQDPDASVNTEEFRNLLTLQLDWAGKPPAKRAEVGLMYLQKGLRWIPNYKVSIDDEGTATVMLQATLVNELTDLDDVRCNLVVGVPTFRFEEFKDPMGIQQVMANVARESARGIYAYRRNAGASLTNVVRNSIMSQTVSHNDYEYASGDGSQGQVSPEAIGAQGVEDLHVFTIEHITLKKGERMVVPVTTFRIPYRHVYTVDLPVAPPREMWGHLNSTQQSRIAKMLAQPKVNHVLRLKNDSQYPLTTAPALILHNDSILGQGHMLYTSKGGSVDLPITVAVDVKMKKREKETKRTPNAVSWQGDKYMRVDMAGTITLRNFKKKPVDVEIVRYLVGDVTEAGQDGAIRMMNTMESDIDDASERIHFPDWWGYSNWPRWMSYLNGIGEIRWKQTLAAGESKDVTYAWHYFYR